MRALSRVKAPGVARNTYDEETAAAYRAVREVPRDGLSEWRDAVRRHLRPSAGMTVVDVGAGTGQFAAAFSDWFGVSVLAVEPSAAMRAQIPRSSPIAVFEGNATALPLPDQSADAAWLSLVIHPSRTSRWPRERSAAFFDRAHPSSSDKASRIDTSRWAP